MALNYVFVSLIFQWMSFVCVANGYEDNDNQATEYYSCFMSSRELPKTLKCNGYPDCKFGEDEIGCFCNNNLQFSCKSGGCVRKTQVCDGYTDCLDGSDEWGCPCKYFYCNMTKQCLILKKYCPDPELQSTIPCDGFRCKTNQCFPNIRICDNYEDCDDGSDEINCPCKIGKVKCKMGSKCILKEWLCDGYKECPGGTDEESCWCNKRKYFECHYKHECVPINKTCDGYFDCMDGSDELNCVTSDNDGLLKGFKSSRYLPFCANNWSNSWNEKICSSMNKGPPLGNAFFKKTPSYKTLLVAQNNKLSFLNDNFLESPDCTSKKIVYLTCSQSNCGLPSLESLTPYIIGGYISPPTQWPYVVSILRHSFYVCTGVLIDESWVLTAAHCFGFISTNYEPMDAHFMPWIYSVRAGSNVLLGSDSNTQEIRVKKIHRHSKFKTNNYALYPDIALLELIKPATMSSHVNTACLPSPNFKSSLCYAIGWGITNIEEFGQGTNFLRQAKMQIDLKSSCIFFDSQTSLYPGQMCVGYPTESVKPCKGDSGGPLMCMSPARRWSVVGILSSGPDNFGTCASKSAKGAIYTNVEHFLDWISITKSHRI